ncbi:MAG: rhomboid family intramembrane serine protease [Prevotellaceae bacterium]|jgi:membrane associated rhomboid family serine protease|nr:rhomboid family intramembrane serine protease [Prevotellaceae bacterium]
MVQSRYSFLANIPPVTLNLLIINAIFLLADTVLESRFGINLSKFLGLHFIESELFNPLQSISYMFMHANFTHLFFNMFGVYMFGSVLERIWGGKKFLFFYFIAGIGAALVQEVVWYVDYISLTKNLDAQSFGAIMDIVNNEGRDLIAENKNYTDKILGGVNVLINVSTVGASGSLFGVLFAFGFMFPQEKLMMIFIPIPIPARIFVIIYAVAELFFGVANFKFDNVAHFAHLGGALFGLIIIFIWRKRGRLFNYKL